MAEPKLPTPAAFIWHQHLGEKTKSLRWTQPGQWEYAEKVEPLYTEEQVRELLRTSGVRACDGTYAEDGETRSRLRFLRRVCASELAGLSRTEALRMIEWLEHDLGVPEVPRG